MVNQNELSPSTGPEIESPVEKEPRVESAEDALGKENDELDAAYRRTEQLSERIKGGIIEGSKELTDKSPYLVDLYKDDPAELLRANIAAIELHLGSHESPARSALITELAVLSQELDRADPIPDVEATPMGAYLVYKKHLDLSETQLSAGKTLDVGAGDRHFAAACLSTGVSQEVYSLEPFAFYPRGGQRRQEAKVLLNKVLKPTERAMLDSHSVVGLAENIPFPDQSFDLALVHAGGSFEDEEGVTHGTSEYLEISRVLKVGGEFKTDAHLLDWQPTDSPGVKEDFDLGRYMSEYNQKCASELKKVQDTGKFEIVISKEDVKEFPDGKATFCLLSIKRIAA